MATPEQAISRKTVGHPVPMWSQKWGEPFKAQQHYDFRTEKIGYTTVDSLKGGGYFSTTNEADGTLIAWSCRLWPQIEDQTVSVLREKLSGVESENSEAMKQVIREIRGSMPMLSMDSKEGMAIHVPKPGKIIAARRFPREGILNFPISLQDVFPDSVLPLLSGLTLRLRTILEGRDVEDLKTQFHHRLQRGMLSERGARSLMSPVLEIEEAVVRRSR